MSRARPSFALQICETADAAAGAAARLIAQRIRSDPGRPLGLATGATMIPVYARLAAAFRAGEVSFARSSSFNLDEYVGLSSSHPAGFHVFMREHLFAHVDLPPDRALLPDGAAADAHAEAADYERRIERAAGIGLQVLGVGVNGHIGFNEPGSPFTSRTRVVELTAETRRANARFFPPGESVPLRAITMGIGTILEADEILLVATGGRKRDALAAALLGPIGEHCPASALRLHERVRIICDQAAGAAIPATLIEAARDERA